MAKNVFRQSRHPVIRWWWEMDRTMFILLLLVIVVGGLVVSTASVAVAGKYAVNPLHFAVKQYIFLGAALVGILTCTMFRPSGMKRLGWLMYIAALVGIALTLVMGADVKGATRWIYIAGQSVQPSEFMKPALILVTAHLLSTADDAVRNQRFLISIGVLGLIALFLLQQPDVGMLLLLGMVWGAQVFLSGMSLLWLAPLALTGLATVVGAYITFEHVRSRVARFLNPEGTDTYQVDQAREAILTGHLFGRGAGEGVVKHTLPDAHTDFIFAVLAEEFGILACLFLLSLYMAIVVRGFWQMLRQEDRFVFLALGGFLTLLALQVLVNIGVALQLLPTTGMTLPFISYGGSATLSMALCMGFTLALLRKRRLKV